VRIWLFLKCVQFLKSCVQFLMDHIMNPAIAQFLMKKNRDALSVLCVSHLNKGRRANEMRVSHLNKWRCTLWKRVSPLLHMPKKEYPQIILHGTVLAPTRSMTFGTHTRTYVCQWSLCMPGARSTAWSTSCVTSSKHLDCHGFKSW
jgi:hypothetical protein